MKQPQKPQKPQFRANVYLKELIKTVKQEFPKTGKDESKLIEAVNHFYSPANSDPAQTE